MSITCLEDNAWILFDFIRDPVAIDYRKLIEYMALRAKLNMFPYTNVVQFIK